MLKDILTSSVYLVYAYFFVSLYYLLSILYDRWLEIGRVRASRWYSRGRSALVRIVRESELRQSQMLRIGKVRYGSGILRLMGSHSSSYVAQDVPVSQRQLRPHLSPALVHGLEVVVLTGQQAMTVRERQLDRIVMQSQSHLRSSCWISGGYQGPE